LLDSWVHNWEGWALKLLNIMLNTATVSEVKISKMIYAGGDGQLSFN
jgi:hypothetical protein